MLAAVAKAVLYFEPALDALLPASRSSNGNGISSSSSSSSGSSGRKNGSSTTGDPYWCQSNRASVAMRTLPGLADCFALLDRCCYTNQQHHDNNSYYGHYYGDESNNGTAIGGGGRGGVEQVVRAMCLFPATSAYGRSHGFKSDFVHGVYKWDFSGLLPDTGAGTLEFRQVCSRYPCLLCYTSPSIYLPTPFFHQPHLCYYILVHKDCPYHIYHATFHFIYFFFIEEREANKPIHPPKCPGSRTADEARAWVEVGLCFVAGAVDVGHSLDPGVIDGTGDGAGTNSMMDDLWWLLVSYNFRSYFF